MVIIDQIYIVKWHNFIVMKSLVDLKRFIASKKDSIKGLFLTI